jgi:hypothetical protein
MLVKKEHDHFLLGNNFNSVLAKSAIFLPANENLTRKPKTKKHQFCQ